MTSAIKVTNMYNVKGEHIRTTRENVTELRKQFGANWEAYIQAV